MSDGVLEIPVEIGDYCYLIKASCFRRLWIENYSRLAFLEVEDIYYFWEDVKALLEDAGYWGEVEG